MKTRAKTKHKISQFSKRISFIILLIFLLLEAQNFQLQASARNDCELENSELARDFQSMLDSLQKEFGFPGATAAFVLPDGTSGVVATGFADLESGAKMITKSRMLSASIGKTFVGATLVALALEGKLLLDSPLSQWLGQRIWFSRLPNCGEITLRQLLTHSSGLPDHVYQEEFAREVSKMWKGNENPFSPEDLIQFVLDLPPLFEPGMGWSYSDTGYILLGLVIEEVTGEKVFDVIRERFLNPLNLCMTSPSDSCFLPGLASGYMARDNSFGLPEKTTNSDSEMCWHPGFEWTGGGFVSNSLDLAKWGWMLYQGHAMQYPYLEELLKAVSTSHDSDHIQYGAGVAIYRDGPFGQVFGHSGWIPGYCSSMRYYPDYGIAIAFQVNTDIGIVGASAQGLQKIENNLIGTILKALEDRNN